MYRILIFGDWKGITAKIIGKKKNNSVLSIFNRKYSKILRIKGCVLTGFVFSKRHRFAHTQKAKNCKLATLRQAVFLTPFTNRSRLFSENTAECQAPPLGPSVGIVLF